MKIENMVTLQVVFDKLENKNDYLLYFETIFSSQITFCIFRQFLIRMITPYLALIDLTDVDV